MKKFVNILKFYNQFKMSQFLKFCTEFNKNSELFGSNFTDILVIGIYSKEVVFNLIILIYLMKIGKKCFLFNFFQIFTFDQNMSFLCSNSHYLIRILREKFENR
jgi:hypothetical protein